MQLDSEINKAAKVIKDGGVILCPTDTIWGISADARNKVAINRVFKIKNRPADKSLIVLVSSVNMLKKHLTELPAIALELIETATEPTSIIYPTAKGLAKNVSASNGSVAIRIVQDDFCKKLIDTLGFPIISTSANLSGEANPSSFSKISDTIKTKVDFVTKHSTNEEKTSQVSAIYLIEKSSVKKIR